MKSYKIIKLSLIYLATLIFVFSFTACDFTANEQLEKPVEHIALEKETIPVSINDDDVEDDAQVINDTRLDEVILTESEEENQSDSNLVSIVMVGDILLHNGVVESAVREDGTYDFRPIFSEVKDEIMEADLALVNQEVIIGGQELGITGYPSFNAPYEIADALYDTGFDVVCHATNHALDRGKKGIINTLDNWKNYDGIVPIGIYDSEDAFSDICIQEVNGIKIAILNYTYGTNGIAIPADMPYAVNTLNEDKVTADIRLAESEADITICCPHWGTEYNINVDSYQEKWTEIMYDNGVDIVIGTHPHVIEPVTMVKKDDSNHEMLVYYSLGNFVNWTSGVGKDIGRRMVGGMAKITLTKSEDQKVIIDSYDIEPLVCHLQEKYGGVIVYPLDKYSEELAKDNLINRQCSDFSYDYILSLCDEVWGEKAIK